MGIDQLPSSLERAISDLMGSELVAEALGEEVFDYVVRNKHQEWQDYRHQITPWELERFMTRH